MRPALPAAILTIATLASAAAQADPQTVEPLPLVLIDAGRRVEPAETLAVTSGLDVQSVRGRDIGDRVGLISIDTTRAPEQIRTDWEAAQDAFFAGDHARAAAIFETLVTEIVESPAILAANPELRVVGFESLLFLAAIAHGSDDTAGEQARLDLAAMHFGELEPAPKRFPPWEREAYTQAQKRVGEPQGYMTLVAPPDCVPQIDGRTVPRTDTIKLRQGVHALAVRCGDQNSAISVRDVRSEPIVFHPLILARSGFEPGGDDLRLAAGGSASDSELAKDVAAIARAGGWTRILALIGRPGDLRLALIDAQSGTILRDSSVRPDDRDAIQKAAANVLSEADAYAPALAEFQPWYHDAVGWTATGAGLALLGTGIALGQIYGSPSSQEPLAWSLMAAGVGVAATGAVLLVLPAGGIGRRPQEDLRPDRGVAFIGAWTF